VVVFEHLHRISTMANLYVFDIDRLACEAMAPGMGECFAVVAAGDDPTG
jgi:hypothetical protein